RPVVAARRFGSNGADVRRSLDLHARDDPPGVGIGVALAANDGADENIAAIPARDPYATVSPGVDVQRRGAADRLFADFAERRASIVAPVAAPIRRSSGSPAILSLHGRGRQRGQYRGKGSTERAGAQHRNLRTLGRSRAATGLRGNAGAIMY